MKKLIQYEIEKNNLLKYILGSIFIIIMVSFFMMVAMDSVVHENPPYKMTYDSIIKSINSFMMEAFIIWCSVLVAKIVVEEYTNKTILILFTYPVKKSRLILAKMVLIITFGILSTLIGDIIGIVFVSVVDHCLDLLEGEFVIETLFISIENILLGIFTVAVFTLVPYILGIYKKSIAVTIVGGFITSFIVQIFVSQCPGLLQIFICFFVISILLIGVTWKFSAKYVKNIENL